MPQKPPDLFKFWSELKRRKVVKASLVYLAVAFGIIQAAEIIFPRLGLPDWTVTFVLILLIIVFILVIVLTWVYDITPEGIKVTQDQEHELKELKEEGLRGPVKNVTEEGKQAITGAIRDESVLQERIRRLEEQLKEARKNSFRSQLSVGIRKLGIPVLVVALLLLVVLNKQKLTKLLGFTDKRREIAMMHNVNAIMYISSGDYIAASGELDLALASDPEYSYAWGNLAVVSYRLGDLKEAVNQTIKAIGLDPENSKAPYNLAFALHDNKEYDEAIRWYKAAIKIDSAINRDSVYTVSCSALGNLYNSINDPIDAILVLDRARKQFPGAKYIYLIYKNLGNAYLLREQPDSAIKYLELSDSLKPMESETNLFLARAYEAAGLTSKSIEQWERYIALEADTVKAGEARRHMREITLRHYQEIIK